MTLHVYEWFSYACNNSSDHRLVAEFESPAKAAAMAKELGAVFLANAKQAEAAADGEDENWDPWELDPSPALVAFAKKYGTKFAEGLLWGDDGAFTEDLPEIATLGKQVYVYHGYMSGGFDGDLPRILKKAGARKVSLDGGPAWLKFTVKAKKGKVARFQEKLEEITNQRITKNNLCDWKVPWGRLPIETDVDNVVVLHDDAGTTFTLALGAEAIAPLTKWLQKIGAADVQIELVGDKELAKLKAEEAKKDGAADDASAPEPVPAATFDPRGLSFLFTGKLASMSRDEAKARVAAIGGKSAGSVSKTLDVLVVGDDGSPLYGNGAKGDKQRKAEALIKAGAAIRIISEAAFLQLGKDDKKAEDGKETKIGKSASSSKSPKLTLVTKPEDDWTPIACGGTVANDTLYFVGGRGENYMLTSKDGRVFKDVKVKPGRGLRGLLLEGKEAWIVGEYGFLAKSTDGGKRYTEIDTGADGCLYTVAREPGGGVWIGGDDGYLARVEGKKVTRVKGIAGSVHQLLATPYGFLAATDSGLFRVQKGVPVATSLKQPIFKTFVTSSGALLALGYKQMVFRSTNEGSSFKPSKVPPFAKTVVPKKNKRMAAFWEKPGKGLLAAAELPSGRILASGEQGVILYSDDDGVTFTRVKHDLSESVFEVAQVFRGAVYLGGDHHLVLRVE